MVGTTGLDYPPRREWLVVVVLLLGHLLAQVCLAWMDSDTIDEPAHLVAALSYTRKGTFRLYNVNPPLPRVVQGLFLLEPSPDTSMLVEPSYNGERREMGIGEVFREAHPKQYRLLLLRARMGTAVFALFTGVLVWICGNLAFGRPCGLVALAVWCFNPFVLAHGHLATPDMGAAALTLAAAMALRGYLLAPSWPQAGLVGVTLGLAQLCKFTLLLLYPLWLLFWLAALLGSRRPGVLTAHGFFALLLSLLTLNMGYLFQDFGTRLESYHFLSGTLSHLAPDTIDTLTGPGNTLAGTWLGSLPVPLPAPFIEGIDLQARDFDRYAASRASYLIAGQRVEGGRYYYYLYGLIVKSPLGLLGLLPVALALLRRRPVNWIDLALLLLVPLAVLVFVSLQTGMNKHVRYVLPLLPFLAVLAGASARAWQEERRGPRLLVGLLMVWVVLAVLRACRDPLAYFNEAAGGPRGGVRLLAGSNLDWGQGRYRLLDWLAAHPESHPVGVACYGTDPQVFADLGFSPPPPGPGKVRLIGDRTEQGKLGPHPGLFAVSVRLIQGDGEDRPYAYFQHFQPVATAGDSV